MACGLVSSRWGKMLVRNGLLFVCATALFAANDVSGIHGSIEIIRMGTNGKLLHVSDMVELINDSRPPLTQEGDRTFEAYLPAQAKIDSVLAAGPDKVAVLISAIPIAGEPGHFKVNFPLRPGATRIAFNYDLPYRGHATFRTRVRYPLQQLAVMFPLTIEFNSPSSVFHPLPTGGGKYLVEAASKVKAGPGPAFEISGVGDIPALQPGTPAKPQVSAPSATRDRAQSSSPKAAATPAPSMSHQSRTPWWLLASAAVFTLGVFVYVHSRSRKQAVEARRSVVSQTARSRVEVLNEELSRLQLDRARGAITPLEFESARQALEGTVKRALARASRGTA